MKVIDMSAMASNISPTFHLCLASNKCNASYDALKTKKKYVRKNFCFAYRLISGLLLYRTGLTLNLRKIM